VIIRTSHPDELGAVVETLDEAFIYSRGRSISLGTRFPGLFDPENSNGIYLGIEDSRIAVVVATRGFMYRLGDERLSGVMVGGVFTDPDFRHKGHAGFVMNDMQNEMRKAGVDFGVLWASDPRLYQRLGWTSFDAGRCASYDVEPESSRRLSDGRGTRFEVASGNSWMPEVDAFRRAICEKNWLGAIEREAGSYAAVPIPALRMKVLLAKDGDTLIGYCICGEAEGGQVFVYEAHSYLPLGRPLIQCLHEGLCAKTIFINDRVGNCFFDDLTDLSWSNQRLTMFSSFRERASLGDVFVPYIDRI
jgi:predicted N-acetyltransferase YhbS